MFQGKDVLKTLELSPSPLLQVILKAIGAWQLDHPEASKSECAEWLVAEWRGPSRQVWESQVPSKGEKRKR